MFGFITGYVMGRRNGAQGAGWAAGVAAASSPLAADRLSDTDDRIDRLLLVVEAMWSLLREQGLDDEKLRARIAELDRADGTEDGRRVLAPLDCPSCGAKVTPGRAHCQICGADMPASEADPFAGI